MFSLSGDVSLIFKKIQKKDPTTKIKAFNELNEYIDSLDKETHEDELQSVLTFFLYHFCRVVTTEHDKKIRESAHRTLKIFIEKDKRKLAPHMKKIFSLWYISFYDTSNEVADLSKLNFNLAL
jgi:hypothetical protein